jgi:riboflavin kinase/FMN adenylyltransferase
VRVFHGLEAYRRSERPACVALGTFDGLHRGHQAIVAEVLAAAAREGSEAVVITFDPHPLTVVAPPQEPFLLTTIEERIALFEATSIEALIVARFDERTRRMPAAEWLDLLEARVGMRRVVLSSSHTFGRDRQGTPAFLEAWAAPRGIGVTTVAPVTNEGAVISSTAIRERLRAGDVGTAAAWLGRWYSAAGTVVRGEGRGRSLGVPTANLRLPAEKVVPATGVYAAYARLAGEVHMAAASIGTRPTFGGDRLTVEAHLLDLDRDLYGQQVELAFVERLRDELRFATSSALAEQMLADLDAARMLLAMERTRSGGWIA